MSTIRKIPVAAKVAVASKKSSAPPVAAEAGGDAKAGAASKSMNRQDLVAEVADQADLPKTKASAVVDTIFAVIQNALKEKAEVRLTGFGTFSVSTRKATTGRNPAYRGGDRHS